MDFSILNVMHSCRCCLRSPPDKELTTPYIHEGTTEIYSHMLQACFKIPLVLGGSGSSGICSGCVDRLRDALSFKMQVEWCQAELQEWLQGDSDEDDAELKLDMYSPSSPKDERRSESRVPTRSRSRSPLTLRCQALSPSPSRSNWPRSRSPSLFRSRQQSRPRHRRDTGHSRPSSPSRITGRNRAISRSRSSSRSRFTSRNRATSRSKSRRIISRGRESSPRRPTIRSRTSSNSRASRLKRHSRDRSGSRATKRRRSSSHTRPRRRSRESSPSRKETTNREPSLQSKRSEPEQYKPTEDTKSITTQSESNALKPARIDSLAKEGNEQNIIPEFDPSNRAQSITMWIRKVNVCATLNGWSERQLIHNALPKLKGLAQMWYEGLPCVLFSWKKWQAKLLTAFPSKENYGQMLLSMISRRARPGDSLEDYYYDKVAMINRVSEPITGRLAVECVLHGIDDRSVRLGAEDAQFCDLDNLLSYLRNVQPVSNCELNNTSQEFTSQPTDSKSKNKCLNCNQDGHEPKQCPLPLKICSICRMIGHEAGHEQCYTNLQNPANLEMNRHKKCRNCKQGGHLLPQCPFPIKKCTKCLREGHLAEYCHANIQSSGMDGVSFEPFTAKTTAGSVKICHKCKQQGHMAIHCPMHFKRCTKCQKIGHLAEECHNIIQNSSGKMDGVSSTKLPKKLKCFNCKQEGHTLAQCTKPIIKCNRCYKVGHVADQCYTTIHNNSVENLDFDGESLEPNTTGKKNKKCFNCGQMGHFYTQCTLPIEQCDLCYKVGHKTEECFTRKQNKISEVDGESHQSDKKCHKCKEEGHLAAQCTKSIKRCSICFYFGHEAETCSNKPTTDTNS